MEEREYAHISFRKKVSHYHEVVAGLVEKYTPSGGRVVDIGCGLGHVLELVHQRAPGLQLVGADPSDKCLQFTRERLPDASLVQISEDHLDPALLGDDFDTSLMIHSLEHMLSPPDAIRTALSITKPGGHLILAVPNPVRPNVFFGSARKQNYVNRGHVYSWDRPHWMNFLERILELEVVEYAEDEVRFISNRLMRRIPSLKRIEVAAARRLPWWSFSNIAVVRNPGARAAA
ncbi:MAG: class I SAM-dependent methyltransferase [Myxococcota bacterium]